jgi:hypothetical protein
MRRVLDRNGSKTKRESLNPFSLVLAPCVRTLRIAFQAARRNDCMLAGSDSIIIISSRRHSTCRSCASTQNCHDALLASASWRSASSTVSLLGDLARGWRPPVITTVVKDDAARPATEGFFATAATEYMPNRSGCCKVPAPRPD